MICFNLAKDFDYLELALSCSGLQADRASQIA